MYSGTERFFFTIIGGGVEVALVVSILSTEKRAGHIRGEFVKIDRGNDHAS